MCFSREGDMKSGILIKGRKGPNSIFAHAHTFKLLKDKLWQLFSLYKRYILSDAHPCPF